jgi:hypothetical protein
MPNIQRQVHFELFCLGSKIKTIACYVGEIANISTVHAGRAILDLLERHGESAAPYIVSDYLARYGVNDVLDETFSPETAVVI